MGFGIIEDQNAVLGHQFCQINAILFLPACAMASEQSEYDEYGRSFEFHRLHS